MGRNASAALEVDMLQILGVLFQRCAKFVRDIQPC
jgi:hypothetical protein